MPVKLNLLVIRCRDIEKSRLFYEALGMSFAEEQRGRGPKHYLCDTGGTIFVLYPGRNQEPSARLGFVVDDAHHSVQAACAIGGKLAETPKQSRWGYSAKLIDPDGYKVELTQLL